MGSPPENRPLAEAKATGPEPAAPSAFERVRLALAQGLFNPLDGVTLGDWLGLLARHGRRIPAHYWPRTVFTTGMAALNSGVAAWERWRHAGRLEATPIRPPVFVLGHHRSGTTHLWNVLSRAPGFAYPSILQAVFPHSFLTFEPWVRVPARIFTMRRRPQDRVEIDPDGPIEEERALCTSTFASAQMVRHFPREAAHYRRYLTLRDVPEPERLAWKRAFALFARKLAIRHGTDATLLFKSPDHTAKLRTLLELFPDARFVHVHRDPFVVWASTLRMEHRTRQIYAFQDWPSDADLEDYVLWRYRTMYSAFFEDLPEVPPERFAEVSFRELEADGLGTVRRIFEEWGEPLNPQGERAIRDYLEGIRGYRKNRHPEISEQTRRRIVDAWGFCFDRWGYSKEVG